MQVPSFCVWCILLSPTLTHVVDSKTSVEKCQGAGSSCVAEPWSIAFSRDKESLWGVHQKHGTGRSCFKITSVATGGKLDDKKSV
jgi:hypothetical protein